MPADAGPADPARTVGFVGIGNMGWPMAANLVRAGFQVAVTDAVSGRAARFAAEVGGRACDGAASVAAGADVLVTSLPTSTHVSEVVEQAESALRRGCVVIDMTSGVPAVTRSLAERLAAAGVAMIDAPVSGGVARARSGELAIMIGGSDADVERAEPAPQAMGTSLHRCGGVGAGQATKALNNLVSAAGFLISVEALLIGQQFGLDPEVMVNVLNASSGMNNTTKSQDHPVRALPPFRFRLRPGPDGEGPGDRAGPGPRHGHPVRRAVPRAVGRRGQRPWSRARPHRDRPVQRTAWRGGTPRPPA